MSELHNGAAAKDSGNNYTLAESLGVLHMWRHASSKPTGLTAVLVQGLFVRNTGVSALSYGDGEPKLAGGESTAELERELLVSTLRHDGPGIVSLVVKPSQELCAPPARACMQHQPRALRSSEWLPAEGGTNGLKF